jgi:hypothetical protein
VTTPDPPDPKPDDPKPDDPKPDDPKPDDGATDDERTRTLMTDLQAERKARKKLGDDLAKLQREHMDDDERKAAEAKAAGRAEALAEVNQRLLRAEVRALAATKLADPSDAVRLLDLETFEADDSGAFDNRAISAAIDRLVEDKPYLAKAAPNGGPPKAPQGTRGTPGSPAGGGDAASDGDAWVRGLLKS